MEETFGLLPLLGDLFRSGLVESGVFVGFPQGLRGFLLCLSGSPLFRRRPQNVGVDVPRDGVFAGKLRRRESQTCGRSGRGDYRCGRLGARAARASRLETHGFLGLLRPLQEGDVGLGFSGSCPGGPHELQQSRVAAGVLHVPSGHERLEVVEFAVGRLEAARAVLGSLKHPASSMACFRFTVNWRLWAKLRA